MEGDKVQDFESIIEERRAKDTKFIRYILSIMAVIALLFKEKDDIFIDIAFLFLAFALFNSRYEYSKIAQKKKYYFQKYFGLIIITFYLIRIVSKVFGFGEFS